MMKYFSSLLLIISIFLITSPTLAHEPREGVSGTYTIIVGNRVEPPYAGQKNSFDMFIRDSAGNPVEVNDIDLNVKILFLKNEEFDARILAKKILKGELKEDGDTPSRFNIDYLPTIPGTYGFMVSGTINNIYIEEKYVCGNGSLHPEGRSFSCVTKLQEFPRNRRYHR